MADKGLAVDLYFSRLSDDAPCIGFLVRATEPTDGLSSSDFAETARDLPRCVEFVHAQLSENWRDMSAAVSALQELREHNPNDPRGLPDYFYEGIARQYRELVAAGTRAPQKVIAETYFVDRSRVSRWLKTARRRGLLEACA